MSSTRTGWWRRVAAAFSVLAVGAATAIALAPAAAADPGSGGASATVEDATLTWGVKQTWRNYIGGAGTITMLGAAEKGDDGLYTWSGGAGTAARDGSAADVAFGSGDGVHFVAHGGVLDLAFTAPQVKFTSATTAQLLLDASDHDDTSSGVHFADVELPTPSVSGDTVTWSNAAVTLTAEGNDAFDDNYSTGESLDPLTLSITLAPEPVWEPQIKVYLENGVTPVGQMPVYEGDKLVIKGTGFDPEANKGGYGAPIPAGLPQGTYLVFGNFAETWQPSTGAKSSTRLGANPQWILSEDILNQIPNDDPGYYQDTVRAAWVPLASDGTFSATVAVDTSKGTVDGGTWGIYTYGAGGVSNADQELKIPLNYRGERPDDEPVWEPQIDVYLADGTTPVGNTAVYDGDKLVVKGTGFDPYANLPTNLSGGAPIPNYLPQGAFVVFSNFAEDWRPSESEPIAKRARTSAQRWLLAEDTLNEVPENFRALIRDQWTKLDRDTGSFTWTVTLTPAESVVDGNRYGIYTYAAGANAIANANSDQELEVILNYQGTRPSGENPGGGGTGGGDSTGPLRTNVTTHQASTTDGIALNVNGTGYINLPTPTSGSPAGIYAVLYNAKTTSWNDINSSFDGSSGSSAVLDQQYIPSGSISGGAWSTSLSAPPSAVSANGDYRVVVWAAHGNLTSATFIAEVRVSLTDGASGDGPGANQKPIVGKITVDLAANRTQTITASGFKPGELVHGELHSTVIDLGTQTADKDGKVTFTFEVPADFETGKHEVVLKGADSGHSVTAGFTVTNSKAAASTTGAAATTSVTGQNADVICTPEDVPATAGTPRLAWGVKSSFVSYVESGIANGTVTPAGGAARSGGGFTWGTGTGTLDSSGHGTVSFPGSLHFTGHEGALDLTLGTPKVTITSGTTGTLTATVKSQDMSGNPVPGGTVALANLTFSSLSATGGTATATLTAAGAAAFAGFYQAGEQLDPVTVSFTGAKPAGTRQVCRDASGNVVDAAGNAAAQGTAGLASTGVPAGTMLGLAVALMIAGAAVLALETARRRRSTAGSH